MTRLLQELRSGNRDAASPLFDQVYSELHAIAAGYVRRERPGGILQPTALVNEAYLRLFGESIRTYKAGSISFGWLRA